MDNTLINETANLVEARYKGDNTIGDIVRWMFRLNLINAVAARNAIIKDYHISNLQSKSVQEIVLDCATNFDVSCELVKKVIYETT